ncbi:MAG: type II toxin-antitoxin system RelE/ParE family toxin [Pseudochelatococcus sp.]|uniref:type II toxin-antitoxin system RelE/ParE family toxin n=1 Tax=Pseudochelatococcus sp. TaxID=2020869 RepID=UPI003D9326A4
MKSRPVAFSPAAREDLRRVYDHIAAAGSPVNASRYVERIWGFCLGLEIASERGHRRDDVSPGLRVVGFEKRITIAFSVEEDSVHILRIFYGGVDWESIL